MILYQDADSICKRYLDDEEGIEETRAATAGADVVATSLVSFAEVKGVLVRARRQRRIRSVRQYERVSREFERDWPDYYRITVDEAIAQRAGGLAEQYALTGLDAIQLASALTLRDLVPDTVEISTWDRDLQVAIKAEGLSLAHEVN